MIEVIGKSLKKKIITVNASDHKFLLIIGFFIFRVFYKLFKPKRAFKINNIEFDYFYHSHGTWLNERCIEVPFVWYHIQKCNGRILEVGNVLHWYYSISHDILDKYE
ncbi:MAG: hypothetical protein KKG04_07855, partial [Candidatus Thermoplasmatota archaeon]|nr:hypothetical protein [Candidatus Thermoplasmatota archaeon]